MGIMDDEEKDLYVRGSMTLTGKGHRNLYGSSDVFYMIGMKRRGGYEISVINGDNMSAEQLDKYERAEEIQVKRLDQGELLRELHSLAGFEKPDEWVDRSEGDELDE